MFRLRIALFAIAVTFAHWTTFQDSADAGLLRDWLARRRARLAQRNCCQTPALSAPVNTVAYNPLGLQPGQCATTCQKTCSRVVVNYVPCTSYRTSYQRVPVTQYRPQTSTDPCTGCSVTCMRPCTTYTYRMSRVPYTTYRPVYRTETYRVPVTTISNDCNTCGVGTCNTCATGVASPVIGQQVPGGTITTDGTFNSLPAGSTVTPLPTPADSTPSIVNPQDSNRSVIDSIGGSSTRFQIPQQTQQDDWTLTSTEPKSTMNRDWNNVPVSSVASASPVTKKWKYSPVKQATYVSLSVEPKVKTIQGKFEPIVQQDDIASANNPNQQWETVEW